MCFQGSRGCIANVSVSSWLRLTYSALLERGHLEGDTARSHQYLSGMASGLPSLLPLPQGWWPAVKGLGFQGCPKCSGS